MGAKTESVHATKEQGTCKHSVGVGKSRIKTLEHAVVASRRTRIIRLEPVNLQLGDVGFGSNTGHTVVRRNGEIVL